MSMPLSCVAFSPFSAADFEDTSAPDAAAAAAADDDDIYSPKATARMYSISFSFSVILFGILTAIASHKPVPKEIVDVEYRHLTIEKNQPRWCTESSCLEFEMRINEYQNRNISTCDNFFTSTCGNFVSHNFYNRKSVIPEKEMIDKNVFEKLEEEFEKPISDGEFYNECINHYPRLEDTLNISFLRSVLAKHNPRNYPFNSTNDGVFKSMSTFYGKALDLGLIRIKLYAAFNDETMVYLDIPEQIVEESDLDELHLKYQRYGDGFMEQKPKVVEFVKKLDAIIKKMKKPQVPKFKNETYHLLIKRYGIINWELFFEENMKPNLLYPKRNFIRTDNFKYLEEIRDLVAESEVKTIVVYLLAHFIKQMPFLYEPPKSRQRTKACRNLLYVMFPKEIRERFMELTIEPYLEAEYKTIGTNIKNALISKIRNSLWLRNHPNDSVVVLEKMGSLKIHYIDDDYRHYERFVDWYSNNEVDRPLTWRLNIEKALNSFSLFLNNEIKNRKKRVQHELSSDEEIGYDWLSHRINVPVRSVYDGSASFIYGNLPPSMRMTTFGIKLARVIAKMVTKELQEHLYFQRSTSFAKCLLNLYQESVKAKFRVEMKKNEKKMKKLYDQLVIESIALELAFEAMQYDKKRPNVQQLRTCLDDECFFRYYVNAFCAENKKFYKKYARDDEKSEMDWSLIPDIFVNTILSNLAEFSTVFECSENSNMRNVEKCSFF